MKLDDEIRIDAPRDAVFAALNDPDILSINAASAGMLDFARSSELANQAGILDIPTANLERLVKVFTLLATVRGREGSIGPDLEELLNSIARGEPPKRFGIFVGAEELVGLDLAGKQALTLRRTLEELEARANRLGLTGDELFLSYSGIFGNIKDIVGEMGRWLVRIDGVGNSIRNISDLTGNILAGLQSGKGKDIAGAVIISIQQVGPAIVKTLGNLLEKGFKLGAAALLDILGTLDFAALGKSVAAAIGRGIQAIAPRLASLVGIDDKTLEAAERASGNVLQRIAAGLRASAEGVDAFSPIRQLAGDVLDRFRPTKEGRAGDLSQFGLKAVDPGRITPDQINAAKARLKAPFAERFNRILESLMNDPDVAFSLERDPSARRGIRQRAQDVARSELAVDKTLAGLSSRGGLARIGKAQERIAGSPNAADSLREALAGQILSQLTEAQRQALDKFNERASSTPAEFDPLGVTRRQLGAKPDASLLDLFLLAKGVTQGTDETEQKADQPAGTTSPTDPSEQPSVDDSTLLTEKAGALRDAILKAMGITIGEFPSQDRAERMRVREPMLDMSPFLLRSPIPTEREQRFNEEMKRQFDEQQKKLEEQNELMRQNTEAMSRNTEMAVQFTTMLDRFTTALG